MRAKFQAWSPRYAQHDVRRSLIVLLRTAFAFAVLVMYLWTAAAGRAVASDGGAIGPASTECERTVPEEAWKMLNDKGFGVPDDRASGIPYRGLR